MTKPASTIAASENQLDLDLNVKFRSTNPHHRFHIGTVTIGDNLYIDPDIQRLEVKREISKFVNDFNPTALGTLTISVRENKAGAPVWSVVDGQQRLAAARQLGYTEPIPVVFHYGLSRAEEARLFLDLNDRTGVPALVRFRTRLVAQEPVAVAVKAVIDGLGIKLGGSTGFTAISTADKIMGQPMGLAALQWALEIIQKVYDPDGKGGCYNGDVIEAFALVFQHRRDVIEEDRLIAKLASLGGGLHTLVGRGRTNKQVYTGMKIANGIGDAVIQFYNAAKRLRPEFPSRIALLPRTLVTVKSANLPVDDSEFTK